MKKLLIMLFACLSTHQSQADSSLSIGGGWREDNLTWSIAGPHHIPTILSELEWKKIQMFCISGEYRGDVCTHWYLRLSGDYGKVYAGKNIDADYLGNHRTLLFSRSRNAGNRGEAFDLSLGVGYPLRHGCEGLQVIPLVGYAHMEQHFQMRKGYQTFDLFTDQIGPFPGLHSNYRAKWMDAWTGFDILYQCTPCLKLYGYFEYHFSVYHGTGHWNLRRDFLGDFHHRGHGDGYAVTLGGNWEVWNHLSLGLRGHYQYLAIRKGFDKTKFLLPIFNSSGELIDEEVIVGRLPLHRVHTDSISLQLILCYDF